MLISCNSVLDEVPSAFGYGHGTLRYVLRFKRVMIPSSLLDSARQITHCKREIDSIPIALFSVQSALSEALGLGPFTIFSECLTARALQINAMYYPYLAQLPLPALSGMIWFFPTSQRSDGVLRSYSVTTQPRRLQPTGGMQRTIAPGCSRAWSLQGGCLMKLSVRVPGISIRHPGRGCILVARKSPRRR